MTADRHPHSLIDGNGYGLLLHAMVPWERNPVIEHLPDDDPEIAHLQHDRVAGGALRRETSGRAQAQAPGIHDGGKMGYSSRLGNSDRQLSEVAVNVRPGLRGEAPRALQQFAQTAILPLAEMSPPA